MGWRKLLGTGAAAVVAVVLLPAASALAITPDCSAITTIPASGSSPVTCSVANEADLSSILETVDSAYENYVTNGGSAPSTTTIQFSAGIELTSDLPFINGPVIINGENYVLSSVESGGVPQYRGFLLYNSLWQDHDCGNASDGAVCQYAPASYVSDTIENLTIADTAARGGAGGGGAGGGAGLGGAVFAANGVALTLSGDTFSDTSAVGGAGGTYTDTSFATGGGGGGGMGGAGASGSASGYAGGGGGLGAGASGGDGSGTSTGGTGIAYGLESGGWGNVPSNSSTAGANSGGAGGGGGGGGGATGTGAGGGGLNPSGETPYDTDGYEAYGGLYGIGGGGGGGGPGAIGDANGGLGGGQGFPNAEPNGGAGGATNGFGGGSAAPTANGGTGNGGYVTASGNAGFGAGNGINNGTSSTLGSAWLGGGGGAMGGAVFVQMGATVAVNGTISEAGATTTGGGGACHGGSCAGNGSGFGNAIFLQGDGGNIVTGVSAGDSAGSGLTFSPATGQTQIFDDGIVDQLSEGAAAGGEQIPVTNWSFTLAGAGTLELAGNTSLGGGTLNSGTLVIPTAASFHGNVTINSGATMILAGTVSGNVTLNSGGTLCAGQMPSNFTNNGGSITTGCTTPPTVAISSPASGGTYTVNQSVPTSFSCAAGTNTVLSSCTDSGGTSGRSGTLNTATAGVYTYTVTATDADGKTATAAITYTVASPCQTTVAYGLVQLSVAPGGCLQPSANSDTYSTPGPLTMNGLTLPALPAGAEYLATKPTTANPGGSLAVQAPSQSVALPLSIGGADGVTVDLGAFTWNLPAPPAGGSGSATVKTLTLAPKQLLKGMQLGGGVAMAIGKDASGNYYTSFDFTVDLPSLFKSGPSGNAAGMTGSASVRVDSSGVHFNGLSVTVTDAYIGTLKVNSACFAYLPAGSTVSGCPAPAVPATPLPALSCTGSGGDSWVGSADIVLPTSGSPQLSLYGNVTGGSLAGLSAQASGLKVALADDVFLTSVGVSLCLPNASQPLQVQGNATVSAIAQPKNTYLVNVNGTISYSDPWNGQPWTLAAGGDVNIGGEDVGQGSVSFYGSSYVYFEVNSSLNLANIATLSGYIEGWLETQTPYQFNVQGQIQLSIKDVGTFTGSGAVSSVGASGCATVGNISYWTLEKDSDWKWYEPWLVHFVEQTVSWQAGFGYYWGDSTPSIWATSCDIGNYELSTPAGVGAAAAAHTAAATTSFRVQNAHAPMAVRINGAGSAPTIELKTPSGHVIAPPAGGKIGEKIPGIGMLIENRRAHDTTVLLTSPAKGLWHVVPVSGSVRVTSIAIAKVVPPPIVTGAAKALKGGRVGLGVAYSLQAGEKMTLYVSGPRHSQQVLGLARGKRCPGHHAGPSSQLCAHLSFRPIYGPSGTRTIYAAVTNAKRLPVATIKIGTIKLRFTKPRAGKPVILRKGTSVEVEWLPVANASNYVVSLVLSDGRKLSHTSNKVTWTEKGVARTETVKATVWPVMPDGAIGKSAGVTLKSGQARTGAKPKRG